MNCFKVSTVVTVLNEKENITLLLDNLLSQSRVFDELIIVDGGSVDGTIEEIKEYSKSYNLIRLIVEKGLNISQGRNVAIREACHPIIAVIDSGCRPDRYWLEELIKPFEEDDSLEVVAGMIKIESYNKFEFFSGLLTLPGGVREIDEDNFPIYGRSAAFKKEIWEKVGGYPEWLYTAEDTLFADKLRKIGAKIKFSRKSIVYWRPRKNLWKLGKMFYLYGKGSGRIAKIPEGTNYHLRNYLISVIILGLSFFYPILFLAFAVGVLYFYKGFYRPIINRIKKVNPGWKAEFYVPLIVSVRTISFCIGIIVGYYEYKYKSGFKENLKSYIRNNTT